MFGRFVTAVMEDYEFMMLSTPVLKLRTTTDPRPRFVILSYREAFFNREPQQSSTFSDFDHFSMSSLGREL